MPAPIEAGKQLAILELRKQGLSYNKIALALSIDKRTVAGYCDPARKEKARQSAADYRSKNPARVLASRLRSEAKHIESRRANCRRYYANNRARLCAQANEKRASDREATRAINRKSYAKHREKRAAEKRDYNATYPDRAKTARERHYRKSRHLYIAGAALRRARKIQATPSWLTSEQLYSIGLMYELAVTLERETGNKYHVDHIVPLVAKIDSAHVACGLHVPWNLQVIPGVENLHKGCRLA